MDLRGKLRIAGIVTLLAGVGLATAGCGAADDICVGGDGCEVKLTLVDKCNFRTQSEYFELAVFTNGCPSEDNQKNGFVLAAEQRQTVLASSSPSAVRGLAEQRYGFMGLYRDQDCRVVAWGCVEADLAEVGELRLAMLNWSNASLCTPAANASCNTGESCVTGRCQ